MYKRFFCPRARMASDSRSDSRQPARGQNKPFIHGQTWMNPVHTYPFHVQIVEIRAKIGHKTVFSVIIKEFIKVFYNIQTGFLTSLKVITRALHPALGTDATLHTRRREASRISRIFYVWTVFTHSHVTALDQLKPRKLGRYVWTTVHIYLRSYRGCDWSRAVTCLCMNTVDT